jgi:F-type H+-transporting ATPase subunit b
MRNHWRLLAACGVLCVAPLLAHAQQREPTHTAAPAAGHSAAAPAAHGGEHDADAQKPALLQFDPGAAVWSIVIFFLLLVLLRATAWKPILRVLQEREEFIKGSIADAKREREQAEQLLAEYKTQLEKARTEVAEIVAEGRRDAEATSRRIQEQARHDADETANRARREIELAADTARKGLHDEAAQLAVLVAGRIIRKELSPADHSALVAESLKEMQNAGSARMN